MMLCACIEPPTSRCYCLQTFHEEKVHTCENRIVVPEFKQQNAFLGLPLELCLEEITLLHNQGALQLTRLCTRASVSMLYATW
jgi:hypothetical protein